jgi:hypothetical protein
VPAAPSVSGDEKALPRMRQSPGDSIGCYDDGQAIDRGQQIPDEVSPSCPQELSLTLQPGGWVPVDDLLTAAEKYGFPITYDELVEVRRDG